MASIATWIALLRGVNVGGHNLVPMQRLRTLLAGLGFSDVATYIQSGNCVFRAAGEPAELAERIANAIAATFGFRPSVLVLSREALEAALAGNPFPDHDPKTVHLFFLEAEVETIDAAALAALSAPGDDFRLAGRVFYLLTPAGIGRSRLAARLETFLPVAMTGRNLRSVAKIAELARAVGG